MAFPKIIKRAVIVLVLLSIVTVLQLSNKTLMVVPYSEEGIIVITAAGSRPPNQVSKNLILLHEPVRYKSQLHQHFGRIFRVAPEVFEPLLMDNAESAVRQGITVFALTRARCRLKLVCDLQEKFISVSREPGYEDFDFDVWFHLIPVQTPLSNVVRVRLEVGSRLKVDESDSHSIWLTTATDGAYKDEYGLVIVNFDLFKSATMSVHGTNVVFNISNILEAETEAPANLRGRLGEGPPQVLHIIATEVPMWFKDVSDHDDEREDL